MNARSRVTRRPERAEDAAFRYALFRASRSPAESLDGLDPRLAERLHRQQFAGQDASYRATHPRGRFEIVESGGAPVGRIVTDPSADTLRLVDLALLPECRGHGIGTGLLRTLQEEARAAGVPLRLSVLRSNAGALRLYGRLGFVPAGATDVSVDLQWIP